MQSTSHQNEMGNSFVVNPIIKICQGVFSVLKFFSGVAVSDSARVGTRDAPSLNPKSDQYLFFMMRKVSWKNASNVSWKEKRYGRTSLSLKL